MLRKFRISKPAQHKPWGRRLTLQCLEERLALSTASPTTPFTPSSTLNFDLSIEGGFVNVSVLQQGVNFFNSDAVPTVSFGEFRLSDVLDEQPFFDIDGVLGNDLSIIPPPDPFPSDPGGGMVGPLAESLPFGPLPAGVILPEALAEESAIVEETPQRQVHEIALSRGRGIFFKVATLAPPQALVRPDRIALGASAAHHEFLQTKSVPVASEEQSYGHKTESSSEAAAADHPATEKVGSVLPPQETGRTARSATNHSKIDKPSALSQLEIGMRDVSTSANQTLPASLPKTAVTFADLPSTASQPATVGVPEEEARRQVFADWRNCDLLALPVLIALATGPRIVRGRRDLADKIQQIPPRRNS